MIDTGVGGYDLVIISGPGIQIIQDREVRPSTRCFVGRG